MKYKPPAATFCTVHVWPAGTTKSSAPRASNESFAVSKSCELVAFVPALLFWSYNTTVLPPGVHVAAAVAVDVAATVDVEVAVAATVDVAVGVPHPDPELNTSEKRLIEPVSMPALSLTLSTHVPSAFVPSNADSGPVVSGEKLPDSNCPVTLVKVDTFGNPPSSLMFVRQMFSLVPPRRAWNVVVVVPFGAVSLNVRSPMNV